MSNVGKTNKTLVLPRELRLSRIDLLVLLQWSGVLILNVLHKLTVPEALVADAALRLHRLIPRSTCPVVALFALTGNRGLGDAASSFPLDTFLLHMDGNSWFSAVGFVWFKFNSITWEHFQVAVNSKLVVVDNVGEEIGGRGGG